MSIKGKVKTIPPYYPVYGQQSFDFKDGTPKNFIIPMKNTLDFIGVTPDDIFSRASSNALVMVPYSRFIPVHYMRYADKNQSQITETSKDEFYTEVVRRRVNEFIAENEIMDSAVQRKIKLKIPVLAKAKRKLHKNSFMEDYFTRFWVSDKRNGSLLYQNFAERYVVEDRPVILGRNINMNTGGAYSRDDMFNAFSQVKQHLTNFSQRTYTGFLDFLTVLYQSNLIDNSPTAPLRPAVLGVMTPENFVYQKMHWLATGTLDLSYITVLVDQGLDSPRFPVSGLREFYYKHIQPWLTERGVTVWKVPRVFIEDHCFMEEQLPRTGGIMAYKQRCTQFLNNLYSSISSLYQGLREPLTPAIIEPVAQVDGRPVNLDDLLRNIEEVAEDAENAESDDEDFFENGGLDREDSPSEGANEPDPDGDYAEEDEDEGDDDGENWIFEEDDSPMPRAVDEDHEAARLLEELTRTRQERRSQSEISEDEWFNRAIALADSID